MWYPYNSWMNPIGGSIYMNYINKGVILNMFNLLQFLIFSLYLSLPKHSNYVLLDPQIFQKLVLRYSMLWDQYNSHLNITSGSTYMNNGINGIRINMFDSSNYWFYFKILTDQNIEMAYYLTLKYPGKEFWTIQLCGINKTPDWTLRAIP